MTRSKGLLSVGLSLLLIVGTAVFYSFPIKRYSPAAVSKTRAPICWTSSG